MATTIRICALSLAITTATAAWAQDEESATSPKNNSWRSNVITRCLEQYSAEQCQDNEFLEENFHVSSLETAHRAAIRRNRMAEEAMRELVLQYTCSDSPAKTCGDDDSAQCIATVTQTCAKLKTEAALCIKAAETGCANTNNPASCYKQQVARCPSIKKQPINQLLAKYPKLSASQKAKLVSTAKTLDAKTRGWWSDLASWLTSPFN